MNTPKPYRSRPGFRGTPPPATFSLAALPDDALLTEEEVAAVLRVSKSTLADWRRNPSRLEWVILPGGYVRVSASAPASCAAISPVACHVANVVVPKSVRRLSTKRPNEG